MKKVFSRVLSVILAVVVMVSVLAVSASAATPAQVKNYRYYMSIGDSIGSGFGRPEYSKITGGKMLTRSVIGKRIAGSYPDLVGKYTAARTVRNCCVPGMTASALRYIFDDSYTMHAWEAEELGNFTFGAYDVDDIKNWRSAWRSYVRNADLITIDIGVNDTWYSTIALIYYIAEDGHIEGDTRGTLQQELAKYGTWGTVVRNAMYYLVGFANNPAKWAQFWAAWGTNLAEYATVYQKNYSAIVESIHKLNPNADIVGIGTCNSFQQLTLVPIGRKSHTYEIKLATGNMKITLPYVGEVILPDRVHLADSTASMTTSALYDLAYEPVREYYTHVYDNYYYVPIADQTDVMGEGFAIPMYENSSLDGSAFNPHPTAQGHINYAKAIVNVLPANANKVRWLQKSASGWIVPGNDGVTIDTSYSGLARTASHTYYTEHGRLVKKSGTYRINGRSVTLSNGKVVRWN